MKKTAKKATSRKRVKGPTTKRARAKSSTPKTPKRTTKRTAKKAAPAARTTIKRTAKKAAPAARATKRPAKKKAPAVRIESVWQAELARIFGTTARNVQRWTEQGMPRHDDGTYPLKECVAWRRERSS